MSVKTEVVTAEKKRIDLIVYSNEYVVTIEHKLGAELYNDLNSYAKKRGISSQVKNGQMGNRKIAT